MQLRIAVFWKLTEQRNSSAVLPAVFYSPDLMTNGHLQTEVPKAFLTLSDQTAVNTDLYMYNS